MNERTNNLRRYGQSVIVRDSEGYTDQEVLTKLFEVAMLVLDKTQNFNTITFYKQRPDDSSLGQILYPETKFSFILTVNESEDKNDGAAVQKETSHR